MHIKRKALRIAFEPQNMKKFILSLVSIVLVAASAGAVTKEEMEQARTIAAQAYLRYANNGSGYLDDVKATSMSQLKEKLKAKELENLKAFDAVAVPTDYASWDKDKLVEFWSSTFFTSPKLSDEGKKARSRVASRIKAMTIADPVAEAPSSTPEEPAAIKEEASSPAQAAESPQPAVSEAGQATNDSDVQDAQEADIDVPKKEAGKSNTWIYVAVLCVLVIVVVWLVVYAVNSMKGASGAVKKKEEYDERDEEKSSKTSSVTVVPVTVAAPQTDTNRASADGIRELSADLRQERDENRRLAAKIDELERENLRLKSSNDELKSEIMRLKRELDVASSVAAGREISAEKTSEKVRSARSSAREARKIYLGRANTRGIFVRADRDPVEGRTVYELVTSDGISGSYRVLDDPAVWNMALDSPEEMLVGACTGHNLLDTVGVAEIVTDQSGTAIFEGGCWRVARKAHISYV